MINSHKRWIERVSFPGWEWAVRGSCSYLVDQSSDLWSWLFRFLSGPLSIDWYVLQQQYPTSHSLVHHFHWHCSLHCFVHTCIAQMSSVLCHPLLLRGQLLHWSRIRQHHVVTAYLHGMQLGPLLIPQPSPEIPLLLSVCNVAFQQRDHNQISSSLA